jgi:endoglycosylceramidase
VRTAGFKRGAGLAALAAAALLAALPTASAPGLAPAEPLGHSGRLITDARGRVVVMHGVAVVVGGAFEASEPERTAAQVGFRRADAELLADSGFNVVRLGMFFRGFSPQPGVYNRAYLQSFVRTQRLLARRGIFTLLDFHQDQLSPRFSGRGFPDWFVDDDGLPNTASPFPLGYFVNPALNRAWDNLWANAPDPTGVGIQDRFAQGWARVAREFADEPGLLGYDILNEPWPGTLWPLCASPLGCPPGGFDQTALTAFSNRVIAAVRRADRDHLAFYEPNLQFDVGAATQHGRVADPNTGFSFHNYCLGAAPGLPAIPDPIGACENIGERLVFENALEHSESTGAALIMTEFGDTADPAIHERVAAQADRFGISWTDWAYMGSTGQIKIDPARPPRPSNLRGERLDAVERAYPRLISGTPSFYDYDEDASRFQLVYSPDRFRAGSRTEIWVPRSDFPRGYTVTAEGGRVLSRPGAERLIVAACRGANRIEVVVTAGRGDTDRRQEGSIPSATLAARCG